MARPDFCARWRSALTLVVISLAVAGTAEAEVYRQRTARGGLIVDLAYNSKQLKVQRNRWLTVYVPPGYEQSRNGLPVLYLQDRQNLFSHLPFGNAGPRWNVIETVEKLIAEKRLRPTIIVGIDHAAVDRIEEYQHYTPAGRGYLEFLSKELKPFIDRELRTSASRDQTFSGGSSLGANAALGTLIEKPAQFGGALIQSPAFWIAEQRVIALAEQKLGSDVRVYLDAGDREVAEIKDGTKAFYQLLLKRGKVAENWNAKVTPGPKLWHLIGSGGHNELDWGRRLGPALERLIGPPTE
ncbi:MAG: esterase family protein [Deltaproteobacteria bacterium]|nr:esterase family protein [Deltaproteobacteria bacterium]